MPTNRIEHSTTVMEGWAPIRLVTLSAVVDSSAVKTSIIPKGTAICVSPGAHKARDKPVLIEVAAKQFTLELVDLKVVKLRT